MFLHNLQEFYDDLGSGSDEYLKKDKELGWRERWRLTCFLPCFSALLRVLRQSAKTLTNTMKDPNKIDLLSLENI